MNEPLSKCLEMLKDGDIEIFNGMKVGFLKNSYANNDLFEYCEEKNLSIDTILYSEFDGIITDIFNLFSEFTGLEFEFIAAENFKDEYDMFRNKEVQIICSVSGDYNWAKKNGIKLSKEFLDVPVVMVNDGTIKNSCDIVAAMPEELNLSEKVATDKNVIKIKYFKDYTE